jgi:energy-coupling factor transport system permease protein
MDARPVVAWSAAALVVVLASGSPAYRLLALAAILTVVLGSAGLARSRRLLLGAALLGASAALFNVLLSHVGGTVLFEVPVSVPAVGGPYTLEALAFGLVTGVTLAAALLAVAPLSLLLEPHEVVDALPRALARTGGAVASGLNLVPGIIATFTAVTEAQRLRGWRPRGPASWAEIVVPVVLTSIEDSIQLAESMEARGFGSGPRTHLRRPRLARADWLVLAASALAAGSFLLSRAAGWAADWYPYPFLQWPEVSALPAAACLLLAVPVLPWWRRSRA